MSKRVFQLRKRLDSNTVAPADDTKDKPHPPATTLDNKSYLSNQAKLPSDDGAFSFRGEQPQQQREQSSHTTFSGPKLTMDRSYIHFQKVIGRVDIQQIYISNVGSSAIYYEWIRLPRSRINPNAVLDQTPKFFCHHDKNVIKPGESISFVFSFLSKIPGIFIEEYEFRCQPQPLTPLPTLKLEGKAIIIDEFQDTRNGYSNQLAREFVEKNVKEILSDLIDLVKSPEQPRPNMEDTKVASVQFEKVNENYGIFHNQLVFRWWRQLYGEVADKLGIPKEEQYWSGSIDELKQLIKKLTDEVDIECFTERVSNYLHWSRRKRADRSALFNQVKDIFGKVVMSIAGEFNDTARKELEMWQVPWREPLDAGSEVQKKARDDQVAKIKAQWLKKAKKKKWGEEEQKAMVADYRNRVESKAKEALLNNFEELDTSADYTRINQLAAKAPLKRSYFRWMERLKTIRQTEVEGRKILLKVELRLRPGAENKLAQMQTFIVRRKEYEKKLEEERKQQQGKDKKKAKKAPKKKQEEASPEFDLMQVLDQQSCRDIVETLKHLQQRSAKIIIVACSYGPKTGVENPEYSLEFFLDYLKSTTDPSIIFVKAKELNELPERIENESYPEGSTLLLENINFLPAEALTTQNGGVVSRLLMDEISSGVHLFELCTDVIVNDNKDQKESGLALYLKKDNVLGFSWWRQIGIALKAEQSDMIIAGRITPQKLTMLEGAIWYAKRVFLAGEIGLKFAMCKNNIQQILNVKLTKAEQRAINIVLKRLSMEWDAHLPKHKKSPQPQRAQFLYLTDILVGEKEGDWPTISSATKSAQLTEESISQLDKTKVALDIGEQTLKQLLQYIQSSRHVFMIEDLALDERSLYSTQAVFKHFYKMKEAREVRHQQQQKKGINYRMDTIFTLIGDFDQRAQRVELKQKVIKNKSDNEQEEQEEEKADEQTQVVRNISLIQDFYLQDPQYVIRLLSGEFVPSLSNIGKYSKSDD